MTVKSHFFKRVIAFVAVVVICLSSLTAYSQPAYASSVYIEITSKSVNIRSGAGASFSRLGTAMKGNRYDYLAKKMDSSGKTWYQIRLKKGKGWVVSRYSRIISVTTAATPTTAISNKVPTSATSTTRAPIPSHPQ